VLVLNLINRFSDELTKGL